MITAYDYPLIGVFLSMLGLFLVIALIVLVFRVLGDIFHSHDLSGIAKAAWVLFVIAVPVVGVLVYLIARGHKMAEHAVTSPSYIDQNPGMGNIV